MGIHSKQSNTLYISTIAVAVGGCVAMTWKYVSRGILLDWDIDAFIEITSQFMDGKLIYFDYFDPKWPHIQPLFAVAALTRSANAQVWFSSLMLIASGAMISRMPYHESSRRAPTQASLMCGGCYIVLTPYLPGGIQGQLGAYASLFLICALTAYLESQKQQGIKRNLLLWLAGFMIGFAIGVRPNILFAVLLVSAFNLYYSRVPIRVFLRFAAGAMAGILLPFTPYFGNLQGLSLAWSGSIGILKEWNSSFYETATWSQFGREISVLWSPKLYSVPFWLFIPLIISGCYLMIKADRRRNWQILISIILWELGLIASYRVSHIHHHYILLEWAGILTGLSLISSRPPVKFICLAFSVAVIGSALIPLKPLSAHDRDMLSTIEYSNRLVRNTDKAQQISAPSLPRLHWQNNKPIRTRGIHPVWSIDIMHRNLSGPDASRLGLDYTWAQQCEIWKQPDVVYFFADQYLSEQCDLINSKDWVLLRHGDEINRIDQNIRIYKRKRI